MKNWEVTAIVDATQVLGGFKEETRGETICKGYVLTCLESGVFLGLFEAESEGAAIAAHFSDVGYECTFTNDTYVFLGLEDAGLCRPSKVRTREVVEPGIQG